MTEDEKKEQSFKTLLERVKRLRMRELFEEPCPLYEPEWDSDTRMTYDDHE